MPQYRTLFHKSQLYKAAIYKKILFYSTHILLQVLRPGLGSLSALSVKLIHLHSQISFKFGRLPAGSIREVSLTEE